MAYILQSQRAMLMAHPEQILTSHQIAAYRNLITRRVAGYPLPYLLGLVEFYGLTFEVTPEVLIPRPETEILVELALDRPATHIVDVGTGSGCIAVTLAVHQPQVQITAIDISPAALAVAQRNIDRHDVQSQVHLMTGDVLTPRPGIADLIVSNPPYIPTGQCASLQASVRDHEPRQALDGGSDGLAIIQQLLSQAPSILQPNGRLLIEIGADQGAVAYDLALVAFPHARIRIHRDLAGRERVLEVQT